MGQGRRHLPDEVGLPCQLTDPDRPETPPLLAYAHGWGPGTRGELGSTPVGGDDFAEHFTLATPLSGFGGDPLLKVIRRYSLLGGWMILTVDTETCTMSFCADESR